MINILKNYIRINKIFWKYKHLIHKDIWINYLDSYKSERRNFYSNFADNHSVNAVFEFGCASGPNLKNIQSYAAFEPFCFGIDINADAINLAKQNFNSEKSYFTTEHNRNLIEKTLRKWSLSSFDIAIYDRVLYLLSEKEVFKHFEEYGDLFKFVIIDDFHNADLRDQNDSYKSKNYKDILSKCGFQLIQNNKSEHKVGDAFFERSARRLVFSQIQKNI